MTSPTAPPDDFEVGKAIFEKLKDLPPERQQRVLRWVAEGLGVPVASAGSGISEQWIRTAPTAQGPQSMPLENLAPKDIKSFMGEKNPRSDVQFAAAVAYYYRFEAPPAQRRDTIDAKLLQEATRLVGRARFANPRFTLNNAKSQGYLDASARGEFSINTVGENLVAMALPGEGRSGGVAPKTKKPRRKRPAHRAKAAGRKQR
jgi:hypothetical protein